MVASARTESATGYVHVRCMIACVSRQSRVVVYTDYCIAGGDPRASVDSDRDPRSAVDPGTARVESVQSAQCTQPCDPFAFPLFVAASCTSRTPVGVQQLAQLNVYTVLH